MNTVLKYPGAKNGIADWICNFIPEHKVYCEVYFESGAVFYNKEPAAIETINDLNSDVINYLRVLREYPEDLIRLLELTAFGREEYNNAYENDPYETDIEKVKKFCVKYFTGFGSSNLYKNGYRSSQKSNSLPVISIV